MISARGAAVAFGDRVLWSDLDLDVAAGEFIAVLGPNGAGKSTLLKAVLGQQALAAGRLSVVGRPAGRSNRAVGYIPQQKAMDAALPLRARDVVGLGIDGHRWGFRRRSQADRQRTRDALAAVGATAYADAPVGLLSGGEQQRVRVAQALATDPSVLLCDEPLLSLDLRHQRAVSSIIERRRREHGTAVLFVTHEINPVLDQVDRVLYLANGQHRLGRPAEVMNSGTLSELYGTPVDVLTVRGRIVVVGTPDGRDVDSSHHDHAPHSPVVAMSDLFDFSDYGQLLGLVHNSLIAAALLGIVGGLVGVFVQMRDMQFAVHGISELSFAGASGALLLGIDVALGSLLGSLVAGALIGVLGVRARDRNSVIGVLMPFGLGVGVLFLALYDGRAANKFGLLTGQIVAVDDVQLGSLVSVSVVVLIGMAVIWRPLTFVSADPEVAAARGIPAGALSVGFTLLLAMAVSLAVQVVGALLVLSLLVTPAAAAFRVTASPTLVPLLSAGFAVVSAVGGILLALGGTLPISPFVTTISFTIYVVCRLVGRRRSRRGWGERAADATDQAPEPAPVA